jgi:hypothetical protein
MSGNRYDSNKRLPPGPPNHIPTGPSLPSWIFWPWMAFLIIVLVMLIVGMIAAW